ncbi:MAG: AAA family ATPase [Solirubrobacterales bacterium]|nr:AAA family ATPase [Solirubrobacterales bacterium]
MNCGTENRAGRKFCSECAALLAIACAACGSANQPGEKFCGECAAPLQAEPPVSVHAAVPDSASPTIERRLVSVLFADLVGFTTLSEAQDAEAVRELLSRYFELARDVIDRYGGTLEKFIGDAVMAVWGAPIAREDDAERAVRAALDLVDAVAALGESSGNADLQLRAGVMTGEAAVTLGAVGQGLVAGDLVNTASRLQSVAPPGSVLVGEATHRVASSAIAFEPAGERILKGKGLPVPAWRATRVVAARRGVGRTEQLEGPFVGRHEEFRLLKELFHATERESRARLVSVIGIGGIGKSRLAWEFEKYIDGVVGDVYWHQGRSPAYGEGITFWALGEMVRRRAQIAEGEDAPATRQKLAASLQEWVPDEGERAWLEPRLAALLGIEANAPGQREELFAAWRTFFERISERGPTVLVFEDLHWADSGLLDFIESMLEWSRSRPILIVTLGRPELLERRPSWGAGQRSFLSLHLEPLNDGAMRELLTGLAPGLPGPLVDQILRRAEGVPMYAVETVRMLIDDGKLVREGNAFTLTQPLDRLEVPTTLQSLIAARLDGLPAASRSLLQTASVLGQSFAPAAAAGLLSQEPETLEPRLRDLVRRELLTLEVDPRSPERGQYRFVQALIREVVYRTLSRADRRQLHVAAARYYEGLGDDELAGVLASHYLAAHEAKPEGEEGAALAAQARVALRGAAERARALHSHEQALAYLEQAIAVTPDPAEQADLRERAATAAGDAARYEIAESHLRAAIAWYREHGDRVRAARATAWLGALMFPMARIEEARATLEPALAELSDAETDPELPRLMAELARVHMFQGEPESALGWLERALPLADALQDPDLVVQLLATRGWALHELSRHQEAVAVLYGAVALGDARGELDGNMRSRMNLSSIMTMEMPHAAFAVARDGVEIALRFGLREAWAVWMYANAASAAFQTGDWDWIFETARRLELDAITSAGRFGATLELAVVTAFRGDYAWARNACQELVPLIAERESGQDRAQLHASLAMVELAGARPEEAFTEGMAGNLRLRMNSDQAAASVHAAAWAATWLHDSDRLREALQAYVAIGLPTDLAQNVIRMTEAALAGLDGEPERALPLFVQAAQYWRERDLPFPLGMCLLSQLTVLGPHHPSSATSAEEARQIFERLNSQPLLARLDAITGDAAPEATPLPAQA